MLSVHKGGLFKYPWSIQTMEYQETVKKNKVNPHKLPWKDASAPWTEQAV